MSRIFVQFLCLAPCVCVCVIKLQLDHDLILDRITKRIICANCGDIFILEQGKCSSCGSFEHTRRADDFSINAVKNRLMKYNAVEKDIVKLFQDNNVPVLTVDGNVEIVEVTKDIKQQLLLFS